MTFRLKLSWFQGIGNNIGLKTISFTQNDHLNAILLCHSFVELTVLSIVKHIKR